jgi:hypothetical protein
MAVSIPRSYDRNMSILWCDRFQHLKPKLAFDSYHTQGTYKNVVGFASVCTNCYYFYYILPPLKLDGGGQQCGKEAQIMKEDDHSYSKELIIGPCTSLNVIHFAT